MLVAVEVKGLQSCESKLLQTRRDGFSYSSLDRVDNHRPCLHDRIKVKPSEMQPNCEA